MPTPHVPTMSRPTVLVLGARGRLGAIATQAFAAAGWRVLAQVRQPPDVLPTGVEGLCLPLHDTAGLAAAAQGAQVVLHAVNPPYDRWDDELLPLARQAMDVAEALGATFLLPGNVYNFGEGMPALLEPQTPFRPTTAKGTQRVQLEAELQERAAGGRMKAVVLRAGDFYGAGRGNWFDQAIVKDIAQGKLVYPGPLDLQHAWAYLPDLAQAFVAVAARAVWREAPAFEVLHFEGHTFTGRELLAALEQAAGELGVQPKRGWRHAGLPWGFIRAMGWVRPMWRELARMSYLWRVPHALDGHALRQAVGPLPPTPGGVAVNRALRELGVGAGAGGRSANRAATPTPAHAGPGQ